MKLIETKLKGIFVIELESFFDERGFFERTWSARYRKRHYARGDCARKPADAKNKSV